MAFAYLFEIISIGKMAFFISFFKDSLISDTIHKLFTSCSKLKCPDFQDKYRETVEKDNKTTEKI